MSTDDVAISTGSAPSSSPGSPECRVKFLCSHGGKILPRPSDGCLKYVGGETRVVSVPTDISFQELMKKLTYEIELEMRLKYQLGSEDLDSLVSVTSDEDLRHMLEEIICRHRSGRGRLRAFLFHLNPPPPLASDTPYSLSPDLREHQRYIDAVNGVTRIKPNPIRLHSPANAMHQCSRVSSGGSSPYSPDSCTTTEPITRNYLNTNRAACRGMHKVRSSPSICSPGVNSSGGSSIHHHVPSFCYQPQPTRLPIEQEKIPRPERLVSVRSVGRAEGVRYQMDHPLPAQYYCLERRMVADRSMSAATSPVSASPLGQGGRAWG